MTHTDMAIYSEVKVAVEEETRKRATAARGAAESLWRATRLRKFTMDEYITHRDNCRAGRHYFPLSGSIPKYTWALLPLPPHDQRPTDRPGHTDGCPACDVKVWDDCLKRAHAAATAALLPGSG